MSKTITLLACLLSGTQVFAQKDTVTLDEVVVTANKIEQKQSTTGKVISVITKAQIEKSGGKTISQLLNEQAGITINGAFNVSIGKKIRNIDFNRKWHYLYSITCIYTSSEVGVSHPIT